MEEVLFFLTVIALVVVTQALVFVIRNRTNQIGLALLPNVGLLLIGVVLSVTGYVVVIGEPGIGWADLGFIILLMVTFITTGISTLISLVLIFVVKPLQPKPRPVQPQAKKKTKK